MVRSKIILNKTNGKKCASKLRARVDTKVLKQKANKYEEKVQTNQQDQIRKIITQMKHQQTSKILNETKRKIRQRKALHKEEKYRTDENR